MSRQADAKSGASPRSKVDARALYLDAVQSPALDVEVLGRLFRRVRGRDARTLREDFCGTAAISVAWVESDDEREALGVDLDAAALRWGRRELVSRLDEDERERLELLCADVRALSRRAFDILLAPNFSWALFDDEALAAYLASAARALEVDGLLALEIFGGRDLRRELLHRHARGGFTYLWEQRSFDPVTERLDARIHFELDDGTVLRDAFAYSFYLRSLARLRELLASAGLAGPRLFVVDERGRARERTREPREDAWNGYLVAGLPARGPRAASPRRETSVRPAGRALGSQRHVTAQPSTAP